MRKYVIIAIIAIITHGAAYYYGYNKPPQLKTVEKEVIKKDVQTVIREITRPDGTKEIETVIVDKTKETVNKVVAANPVKLPMYAVGISYNPFKQVYSADIARRVVGPFYGALSADTAGNAFVGVRVEF